MVGIAWLGIQAEDANDDAHSRTYPFRGLSVREIRDTAEFVAAKRHVGESFDNLLRGATIVSTTPAISLQNRELPEMASRGITELRDRVCARPVTKSNYDALFALTIITRECRHRIAMPPHGELIDKMDVARLRVLWSVLFDVTAELPDSTLRRISTVAMVDCSDLIKQCEIAAAWRESGSQWLDQGHPSLFLHNLVRTLDAYHTVFNGSTDEQTQAIIRAALKRLSGTADGDVPYVPVPRMVQQVHTTSLKARLPEYETKLNGLNEVRILNPTTHAVLVGVRAGRGGVDFEVPGQGKGSVTLPNGDYSIYFVYANEPDNLYRGENFTLRSKGVEIQLVRVRCGNYAIWRVK